MTGKHPIPCPSPRDQVEKRLRHQFGLQKHIARLVFDLHYRKSN